MRSLRAIASAFTVFVVLTCAADALAGQPAVGEAFPVFAAKDAITGESFSLKDYRGKVVLIDFWATWCGPCVAEMPNVKKAYGKYHEQGFEVISISLDSDRRRFEDFVKRKKVAWPQVMDGGGWNTRLAKKYGVRSIPAMFLVDHRGVCVSTRARGKALGPAIKRALAEIPETTDDERIARENERDAARDAGRDGGRAAVGDQIAGARADAEAAAAPIDALAERLARAALYVKTLEISLPVPRDAEAARRMYGRLHQDLDDARCDMFVCGLFDSAPVALPADPFTDADVPDDRALFVAHGELVPAQAAAAAMQAEVARVQREIAAILGQVEQLERRFEHGGDVDRLAERAETVGREAAALHERCRDSWTGQMDVAARMLDEVATPGPRLGARLDALAAQLAECREHLREAAVDRLADRALAEAFTALCADLASLVEELARSGAPTLEPAQLPANPFERSSARSVRARVEAGRQLDRAQAAIDALRGLSGASHGEAQQLQDELADLRADLRADRRADRERAGSDPDRLAALHARFTDLCRRLLALRG